MLRNYFVTSLFFRFYPRFSPELLSLRNATMKRSFIRKVGTNGQKFSEFREESFSVSHVVEKYHLRCHLRFVTSAVLSIKFTKACQSIQPTYFLQLFLRLLILARLSNSYISTILSSCQTKKSKNTVLRLSLYSSKPKITFNVRKYILVENDRKNVAGLRNV